MNYEIIKKKLAIITDVIESELKENKCLYKIRTYFEIGEEQDKVK